MRPVPIMFVIDSLNTGGTEKQLLELAMNLDRRRFEPHLCVLREGGTGLGQQSCLPILVLNFTSFHQPSILRCLWQLKRYIDKHCIRIVQCFFQDAMLLSACSRPLHQALLVGCFRDMGFWRSFKESLKMRLAYPAYCRFIANSEAVKSHFTKADGISPEKIEVIYNGVDLTTIPSRSVSVNYNIPIVGIVANLNRPVKRVNDFISAAALIHKQCPDVRFIVVGGGHLQTKLEEQSREAGLGSVLEFTGLVKNPIEHIRQFSVGVITSESEGFCNAILEYMTCGIPVVATDVGGNSELVRDGENGFLIPVADVEKSAEQILKLLSDKHLRSRIAQENIQTIRNHFALPIMISRYEELYNRLLLKEER